LSAIQVLIQHGAKQNTAMNRVVNAHNELVRRCIQHAQLVCDDPEEVLQKLDYDGVGSGTSKARISLTRPSVFNIFRQPAAIEPKKANKDNIIKYVQLVLGFANGMANWMAVSKRYAS